jgi:hypothetical protein
MALTRWCVVTKGAVRGLVQRARAQGVA